MTTLTAPAPAAHLTAELAAVLRLLERMGANTIVLGSARDAASVATRAALAEAWTERGGEILDSVDWPESAASWLRQARRFAAPKPDAWVVAARPTGWAHMVGRLTDTAWTADRTIVTAALRAPDVLASFDAASFAGLRGVTREGRTWRIGRATAGKR
ncbi:ABC transporter substrate-binding protein [Stackebrandtia nassauensis]|uniref:Uncharacterized protein n=1 Tax=Stackebrandtia nassauensis (strain DSM 44728 / CIP 108903 / NRRL B-16338 / NBRC 102104 / LLR-40K-21) TaxID=446470 RepID=D3Q1Q5_STANL|nr:ABC transporter substrate-binding protein [Stackebrandtia nassauensis]ADD39903.1 hypothetical protein Snas_0184 [Stackebrandtia nassauensis DSM 44728]